MLVSSFDRHRRNAAVFVLDALGSGYEQSGKSKPGWLSELRTRYEAA